MIENSTADGRCPGLPASQRRRPVGASGTGETANPPALGAGDIAFDSRVPDAWACGAAGSAPLWQGGGRRFESGLVHYGVRRPPAEDCERVDVVTRV